MSAAIQEARDWAGTALMRTPPNGAADLLASLKPKPPLTRFQRNGAQVELKPNHVIVSELDQDVKPAEWIVTKVIELADDVPEYERDIIWVEECRWHVVRFAELCQDEAGFHEEYFGGRRARIAKARKGVRI